MLPVFKSQAAFDEEVSRQAMETTEQIIAEMGAEIHDDLIQRLSVLRLHIDHLDRAKGDPAQTEALITRMSADFHEIVDSIRRISRRLLPVHMANDSLEQRIRTLCQNLEQPGRGNIHFLQSGQEQPIPERDVIHLLRIIQELINNALKHSSAWHVEVRLSWDGPSLQLDVEDDGTAFSRIDDYLSILQSKNNTLRMRARILHAPITFSQGQRGLLARLRYTAHSKS